MREWCAVAAGLAVPFMFFTCGVYPFVHNRYVHPLGRLSGSVAQGDSCDAVEADFAAYAREHDSGHMGFTRMPIKTDLLRTREIEPTLGLFLYDLSLFDDVQLQVRCGPDGRVEEVLFIGD